MLNLKDAFDLFIENRETYCSDATVKNYRNTITYFIKYIVMKKGVKKSDDIDITDITIHDLNAYSIILKTRIKNEDNPFCTSGKEIISSRTRKDYLKDVVSFFNFLFDYEYISDNPCKRLKFPRVEVQPIEVLTIPEVEKIDGCFSLTSFYGIRNLAMIHMLLDEGLRSGEIQRLKYKDVHFEENYIVIRNSKGGKGRILPLATVPRDYLTKYLKFRTDIKPDDYVFTDKKGNGLTENSVKCVFQRLKIKSEVTRVYPHLLRHTFATSFILGGGSLEVLRIYMGHSSIETTQKYLHLANNLQFMKNVYPLDECFLKRFY